MPLKLIFIQEEIAPVLTCPELAPAANAGATIVCKPSGPIASFCVKSPAASVVQITTLPGNTPAEIVPSTCTPINPAGTIILPGVLPKNAKAKIIWFVLCYLRIAKTINNRND